MALALLFSMLFVGCQKTPHPEVLFPENFPQNQPASSQTVSEKPSPRVYLDTTPSMQGFAHPGSSGQYGIFLRELDLALEQGWKAVGTQYFRFGTKAAPITGAPAYQAASSVGFYGGEGFTDTQIDLPLDQVNPSGLTLIVTDLFQNGAEVGSLIQKIRQKVLPNRLSVAIIGVKAEFSGTIYDVGQQHMSFPYDSRGNAKKYRPFYLMVIGRLPDVLHLMGQLKAVSRTVRTTDVVFLSPELLLHRLNWKNAEVLSTKGVTQKADVVQPPVPGGLVFKRIGSGEIIEVEAALAYDVLPGAPVVNFNKLARITPQTLLYNSSGFRQRQVRTRLPRRLGRHQKASRCPLSVENSI